MNMHANEQSLQAQIEALRAENAKLKAAKNGPLSMKVSEKGAISIYGMGRFPVTLYKGQMERLLANVDQIKAFIESNADRLQTKD